MTTDLLHTLFNLSPERIKEVAHIAKKIIEVNIEFEEELDRCLIINDRTLQQRITI